MNFAGKKKTVGNQEMGREGVSHISIPYRMTPPPSPLSPRGVGGSKDSPSVLAYISTSQGSYCPARAAPPAAQQPIAFIPQLSTAGIHQLQLSLKCSYFPDYICNFQTFRRKRTQQNLLFVAFTISRPSCPVDHPHQTEY